VAKLQSGKVAKLQSGERDSAFRRPAAGRRTPNSALEPLLSIDNLHVHFDTYAGVVHAVNGMSFAIRPGEIFGLVGESGCGKSVTGLAILRELPGAGRIVDGRILFHGQDILQMSEGEMQNIRGSRISMVFQDPTASLNPVFTAGNQTARLIRLHTGANKKEAGELALAIFAEVGLPDPPGIFKSYPHELSGGMQQRVMIAMALSCGAELLIADEPTTALDVTIQAQILELLASLREREGLSILLITHDLGVIAEMCDRVAVAYAGQVVESGSVDGVLRRPHHPYTRGLLAALPDMSGPDGAAQGETLAVIEGSVPDGLHPLPGCAFHPRCPEVMEDCRSKRPSPVVVNRQQSTINEQSGKVVEWQSGIPHSHEVRCFLYEAQGEPIGDQ
jgi:oligopeptide/dipeptide ABC transporter ATP-binding protein